MRIIGISGYQNSGKDLLAQIIKYCLFLTSKGSIEYRDINKDAYSLKSFTDFCETGACSDFKDVRIDRFAATPKENVANIIGCTISDLEDREFKDTPLGPEWWVYKINGELIPYVGNEGNYDPDKLIKTTPRDIIKKTSNEGGRYSVHPNIWIMTLMSRCLARPDLIWIISDVRLLNEADAIKAAGGFLIRINRGGQENNGDTHYTETALDNYQGFDVVINNDGSIQDLIYLTSALMPITHQPQNG